MENNNLIQLAQFCQLHNIDTAFIFALQEYELVEIVVIENNPYFPQEQLPEVEKMLRLHYDLNINLEGIDAIATLLKRINTLEQELIATKNKLRVFTYD
ncbi:MAG: chaperone modulator CbpM [Haliscomenobacter sp.]|nr:chaperone modulator CbpM [Haliscomenobacter sp.]MBK9492514.1 chaperone modulator CbpM [Haliscomenobacter sp.]